MSLSEEIAIIQFAQGVLSYDKLLEFFTIRDETDFQVTLAELFSLLMPVNPEQADVDNALASSSLGPDYTPLINVNRGLSRTIRLNLAKDEQEKDVKFLLHLFKSTYQRQYTSGAVSLGTWPYQDFSDQDVVDAVLSKQQKLIEQLYNDPSFHSEFASLAKLWHDERNEILAIHQEPSPQQNQYRFISYDEMVTDWLNRPIHRYTHNMRLLHNSLAKAFKKRYSLDDRNATRVIWSVVDRHLREKYNTDLRRRFF